MRYGIIENDTVINVVVGPENWQPEGMQAAMAGDGCVIGATYSNGVFTPPAAPEPPAPTLAEAQALKVAELSVACQADIYAGFRSSALGADYLYPAKDTDQQNLASSVLASILPGQPANWTTPFWCADATGAWAFREHTAAQIQQVGKDGKARIIACMTQNVTLSGQVIAATTIEAVEAIAWTI